MSREADNWMGCYEGGWQYLIVPEAFAHPAKFSYSLILRMLNHAENEGWITKGSIIVDPFGGIGCGGIVAAYSDMVWIGVELELDFCALACSNFLLHCQKGWCTCGSDGQTYLHQLRRTIQKGGKRSKSKTEAENGAVLFKGLSQQPSLQRQETESRKSCPNERASSVEQGQAVEPRDEGKAIGLGEQWKSCDGEERQLAGRAPDTQGWICGNTNRRQTKNGTRSCNGTTSAMQSNSGRDSTSQKRGSARQPHREPRNNDNRRTHETTQSRRQQSKTSGTCENCGKLKVPLPIIIQGDSRKLCEVLESADCVISSPPYAESDPSASHGQGKSRADPNSPNYRPVATRDWQEREKSRKYGSTPGQLGAMKPGQVADVIISSPPYAESLKPETEEQTQRKQERIAKSKTLHDGRKNESPSAGKAGLGGGYGTTPGNLGNLRPGDVACVVSSPPYEGSNQDYVSGYSFIRTDRKYENEVHCGNARYGQSSGQLGQEQGETFWQAARQIVAQCYQILKPGGHAIWVVKAFVRKGKIVDFPGDWERLCASVGFVTVCRHRAMLVKETTHEGLFEPIVEKKERKSFFRRLAESKGSPAIDFEMVICMQKQEAGATK